HPSDRYAFRSVPASPHARLSVVGSTHSSWGPERVRIESFLWPLIAPIDAPSMASWLFWAQRELSMVIQMAGAAFGASNGRAACGPVATGAGASGAGSSSAQDAGSDGSGAVSFCLATCAG